MISARWPAPGSTTKIRSCEIAKASVDASKSANSSISPCGSELPKSRSSSLSTAKEIAPITPTWPLVRFRYTASRLRGRTDKESPDSPTSMVAVTSCVEPLIWRTRPRKPSSTHTTGSLSATPADAWLPSRKTKKSAGTITKMAIRAHTHRGTKSVRTRPFYGVSGPGFDRHRFVSPERHETFAIMPPN